MKGHEHWLQFVDPICRWKLLGFSLTKTPLTFHTFWTLLKHCNDKLYSFCRTLLNLNNLRELLGLETLRGCILLLNFYLVNYFYMFTMDAINFKVFKSTKNWNSVEIRKRFSFTNLQNILKISSYLPLRATPVEQHRFLDIFFGLKER